MKKEKYHIEYIFDTASKLSLWKQLTTARGLSAWFADSVDIKGNLYAFHWDKDVVQAEAVCIKPEEKVRYRWLSEEEEPYYFEFMLRTFELTGAVSLEITDFAETDEKEDAIALWETQVEALKRSLGL
ncbi:MAG: hypothetical protein LBL81_04255 [Tannerella sp.]|jgi:uncharacterized protein YndB with AHSA1/START domain|nr:hypothetical protein [Tannerella sp.]